MTKTKGYKKIGTKNGVGIYETYIIIGYDILTGKPKRKHSIHRGTSESAKLWYADLVKQYYHKGSKTNVNNLTFEEYGNLFIERYCVPNVGVVTLKDYKMLLNDIYPFIGDKPLNKITTMQLDTMYQRLKIGKNGKERSPKTMIHYYDLVGLMFKQAKKWKLIEINQHLDTTRPKVPKKKKKFYDVEQVAKLFECLENENVKYRTIITLALVSGIRRSELCAIRWTDIDFANNSIYIDNSLKVIDGVVDENNAKTEFSVRTIDIDDDTMQLLREYQKWQNEYISNIGNKWVGTDRVFTAINGKHMHPCTCNKILQKIIKKYDLPKITFHELRHTCSSILNGMGIDPVTIKERLGHSTVSVTMDLYTHPLESNKKESANVFTKIRKQENIT